MRTMDAFMVFAFVVGVVCITLGAVGIIREIGGT